MIHYFYAFRQDIFKMRVCKVFCMCLNRGFSRKTRKTRMGGSQDKFLFKRFGQTLNRNLGVPNSIIREIREICDNPRFRHQNGKRLRQRTLSQTFAKYGHTLNCFRVGIIEYP